MSYKAYLKISGITNKKNNLCTFQALLYKHILYAVVPGFFFKVIIIELFNNLLKFLCVITMQFKNFNM